MRLFIQVAVVLLCSFTNSPFSTGVAQEQTILDADRIVFLGDSITYNGQFIIELESYLRSTNPTKCPELLNLGLMSETVTGLSEPGHPFPRPNVHERLKRLLEQTTPDVVVACYGINDGIYHPFSEERFNQFKTGFRDLIDIVLSSGAKFVALTPPPFDSLPGRKSGTLRAIGSGSFDWRNVYEDYDSEVMARYSDWLIAEAKTNNRFEAIDLRTPILSHLFEKREHDANYRLANDGVHLNRTGHRIIARTIASAWNLPFEMQMAPEAIQLIEQKQTAMKLAWLARIGHKRPGVPKGPVLSEAEHKRKITNKKLIELFGSKQRRTSITRVRTKLTNGWRYHLEQPPGNPNQKQYDDGNWAIVSVPHTHRLYSENLDGTDDNEEQRRWHRHVGWYRKDLDVEFKDGKRVYLEFEGSHQVTDCWVNGTHVGQHAIGGYTPFHFDITRYVSLSGPTQVTLKVDNRYNEDVPPDFGRHDYIMPGGLYRDVYLVETGDVHMTFPWESPDSGIFVTTPDVSDENATVNIRFQIRNDHSKRCVGKANIELVDSDANVVAHQSVELNIAPADAKVENCKLTVSNPELWSIESPNLYDVKIKIEGKPVGSDEILCDELSVRTGIRRLEVSEKNGITLNGKLIELIGANRHQQYPYIGNGVPDNLHYHDMWLLKQAGMNCVRLSHYPQDNAILDACDELGLLVTEEPPTWIDTGSGKWVDNLDQAQRRLIRNHRNHPCVFMWAVGINHMGYREHLQLAAEQEDPTRWTHANAAEWGESWQLKKGRATIYGEMGFQHAPIVMKDKLQFTIEHSRGQRGMKQIASAKRRSGHLGLCVWEGFDNHSLKDRAGLSNLIRSGIFDLYRLPRHDFYWYRSELTQRPMIHIVNSIPDAKTPITIYSNCDELELTIDGKDLHRRGPDTNEGYDGLSSPPFTFDTTWNQGELQVRGFVNGKLVVSTTKISPTKPSKLSIDFGLDETTVWPHKVMANGNSIIPIYVRVRDENDTIVQSAKANIRLKLEGPATIVGEGANVAANPVVSRNGYSPFLLRAGNTAGVIKVYATADSLESGTTSFQTN